MRGDLIRKDETLQQESDKGVFKNMQDVLVRNMGVFVILKISSGPSFPKRGFTEYPQKGLKNLKHKK